MSPPVEGTISSGVSVTYEDELEGGRTLIVGVLPVSSGLEPAITVFSADGATLGSGVGNELDESITAEIVIPETGTYFITVEGVDGSAGDYQLFAAIN